MCIRDRYAAEALADEEGLTVTGVELAEKGDVLNLRVLLRYGEEEGEAVVTLSLIHISMFEAVEQIAKKYPGNIAFTFMGKSTTYRQMIREIEQCAKALKTIGVREGDKVTIAMPNCPQAIYMLSLRHISYSTSSDSGRSKRVGCSNRYLKRRTLVA